MPAIESIVTGSGDDSSGEFVAAAPVFFRQFRKIGVPAQSRSAMGLKVAAGGPYGGCHGGGKRRHHSEENRQEHDMADRPVKSINSREHASHLLWGTA